MPGTSSISGVVSGLNTDDIIAKMMAVEKQPVTDLTTKQAGLTQQLSAWQEFNTRLLALQTTAATIASPSSFQSNSVTSTDTSTLTGTAQSDAATGTYNITVATKASTQQLSSQGFANISDAVGMGTVHVSIGDGTTFDVKIDDTNNSFAGLRDAINKSGTGVSAVIVNTGVSSSPYKLLVTSKGSGTANAMTFDTKDLASDGRPVIDQVVQEASDATLTLGSGAGQISVKKSTNSISDVIPGVTLSVNNAKPGQTITLQVSPDTTTMQTNVDNFVKQYNNVVDFLNSQFKFDQTNNQQGVLFGDYQLQTIQASLASAVSSPTGGLSQALKSLSQIGVTTGSDGKLSVNESTLSDALTNNLSQVNALFSTGFDSTNPNVTMYSSTSDTQASGVGGYQVSVTAASLRARVTSGVAQSGVLDQAETMTVNGTAIALNQGLTQDQVIAKINEYTKTTGVTALATGADGTGVGKYLTLQQVAYGASGHVDVRSTVSNSSGITSGLGNVDVTDTSGAGAGESGLGSATAGQDMVGTINGVAAKSTGQYLIAQAGAGGKNAAQGLMLKIDSSVPTTTTVHFTKGAALLVRDLVMQTTALQGSVTVAQSTINTQISNIEKQVTDLNAKMDDKQQQLYDQFNAMESALGQLQAQGQSISALLGSLSTSSTTSSSSSSKTAAG